MKFKTVQIHFLSDIFSLLSSRNFATKATWRDDFSSLRWSASVRDGVQSLQSTG